MRPFQLAPWILLLVACGGSAARNTKPAPSVGGAAGEPSSAAGTPNGAGTGEGGAAGVGAASGAAAIAGAEASDAGAGGQPGSPTCDGLDCLAGAELIYVPDREWQRPASGTPMVELQEADYTPLQGPTWRAKFSIDALAVDLTPTAGGDTVHGTRDTKRADSGWFGLELFAGGRFVVQASSRELRAEYTIYGSGSPIISSTRGLLKSP